MIYGFKGTGNVTNNIHAANMFPGILNNSVIKLLEKIIWRIFCSLCRIFGKEMFIIEALEICEFGIIAENFGNRVSVDMEVYRT